MRVLHIDRGAEMRGGQHQVLLLAVALKQSGHDCKLLARPEGALIRAAEAAGIDVAPAGLREIRSYSQRWDIVHVHDAGAHTLSAIASKREFVVSRRVAFPVNRSWMSRWKYRRASRYLAVSYFVKRQLEEAGIAGDKIDVVYDAVLEGAAAQWSRDAPAVALASQDPAKGRDLVERAAGRAGIPVVFSANLPRDLSYASMFVYATRSEGLGSAALLAMSKGVPVIASRTGGLVEVISDGLDGLLVENDVEGLAAAMRRVKDEPELGRRLIDCAKVKIQSHFTVNHMLEATLASYRRALAG